MDKETALILTALGIFTVAALIMLQPRRVKGRRAGATPNGHGVKAAANGMTAGPMAAAGMVVATTRFLL